MPLYFLNFGRTHVRMLSFFSMPPGASELSFQALDSIFVVLTFILVVCLPGEAEGFTGRRHIHLSALNCTEHFISDLEIVLRIYIDF